MAFDPKVYGPDQGAFSFSDIGSLLLGRTTQFEDQIVSLDVRLSLAGAGVPVLAYTEVGWGIPTVRGADPALRRITLGRSSALPLAFRYEYVAFGAGAGCAPGVTHSLPLVPAHALPERLADRGRAVGAPPGWVRTTAYGRRGWLEYGWQDQGGVSALVGPPRQLEPHRGDSPRGRRPEGRGRERGDRIPVPSCPQAGWRRAEMVGQERRWRIGVTGLL